MSFNKKEATDAVVWLLEANVPSFSPETSKLLLEVSREIEEKLKAASVSAGTREFLQSYANWLYAVSVVSHLHQGAVINTLASLIKAEKGDEA